MGEWIFFFCAKCGARKNRKWKGESNDLGNTAGFEANTKTPIFKYGCRGVYGMNTANLDRFINQTTSTDSTKANQMVARSPTLVICSCTKNKALDLGKAEEMYMGQIFDAINRYRKSHGYDLMFLSAKLGLLSLDSIIEKYDLRLKTSADAKRLQQINLNEQQDFIEFIGNYERIEIIMGSVYESVIIPILKLSKTTAEIYELEKKNLKRLSDGDLTVLKKLEAN